MDMDKKIKRMAVNLFLFLGIMLLTFIYVFKGQDLSGLRVAAREMSTAGIFMTVAISVAFVAAEGCMIWYLLREMGRPSRLGRCIVYSFVGFFFSGITPSATGGQPMQLYWMKRDGNALSESSVVLLTMAAVYKFVLVIMGLGIALFWNRQLQGYLKGYYWLYLLGLFLNSMVVVLLLAVMLFPCGAERIARQVDALGVKSGLLRPSGARKEKIDCFVEEYRKAVSFLCSHKKVIGIVLAGTFVQRCSVFVLAYVVYVGMGLSGTDMLTMMCLQASVYIAVDMLPLPGAQGITEAMYQTVFLKIYTQKYLLASLCFTRGVNFYMLMAIGAVTVCADFLCHLCKSPIR